MSISKRLWDLTRANLSDFTHAFGESSDHFGLTVEERSQLDHELKDSAGTRAGRSARKIKDKATGAWSRASEMGAQLGGEEERLHWFRTLELRPDAQWDEVRQAYRRLVRKYHPDRFMNDPEKYQAATEVARKITEAYDGLRQYFGQ